MKALLVDPSPKTLADIKQMVNWEKPYIHAVLECTDPTQALALIQREMPGILIADIAAPGGLALIEQAAALFPDLRIIVLTASCDFSAVQRAIKLGCSDYLLKPPAADALQEAVEKAAAQYRALHTQAQLSDQGRAQELFSYFLGEGRSAQTLAELQAAAPFLSACSRFRLGVIATRQLPPERGNAYRLAGKFHRDFFRRGLGIAALFGENGDIAFLLPDRSDIAVECQDYFSQYAKAHSLYLHLGLSEAVPLPLQCTGALAAASENALSFYLRGPGPFVQLYAIPCDPLPLAHCETLESQLAAAVQDGSPVRLHAAARELAAVLCGASVLSIHQLEQFRAYYRNLRLQLLHRFVPAQTLLTISPACSLSCAPNGRFDPAYFVRQLTQDLSYIAQHCPRACPQAAGSDAVLQARQYIQEHYAEPLSLSALAAQFALSPSYLSRSFKKVCGIGLVDYINQVRIDHAISLLHSSDLKTQEIAPCVGYSDPKYFCRVFKRITSLSPSAFRAQQKNQK